MCNYADEPSGAVVGFIIETPMKEGVHLMTLMKSLAPLATHLLDAISCHSVHSILDLNITSCASRTLSINLASLLAFQDILLGR